MDLHAYLKTLDAAGELHRVSCEVDPELEITEIALRQVRLGGPALFFERVKGSDFPLVINLNATRQRLEMGLGAAPGELGRRLAGLVPALQPSTFRAVWKNRGMLARLMNARVKKVPSSPAQDEVDLPGDLSRLPVLKCWPKDGGRFLTLPMVQTVHPLSGRFNLGMYRMQVYNATETGMHWQIVRGAESHAYLSTNGRMPCAVALGGDPALILASIFPLPEDIEEFALAGFLRNAPQPLVHARTQPLRVPANAEFILEGIIDLKDRRMEGPFGDHYGHYSRAALYPTFKLTALSHRKNAVYPATVVGKPPLEDKIWGEAINEFSEPMIKLLHPEVAGLWTYYEAGFHNLMVAAVHQRHRKEGIKTALGLLGLGQLSLAKLLILVDPKVNPRDFRAVLAEGARNFDPREDVLLIPGAPLDTLDFSSFITNLGSKLVLDFTSTQGISPRPLGARRAKPSGRAARHFNPDALKRLAGPAYRGWVSLEGMLLAVQVSGTQGGSALLEKILAHAPLGSHKMVFLVSPDVDLTDPVDLMWGLFTRFDAARDIRFTRHSLVGAWPFYEGVLGIDATWKKGYPEPLEMPRRVVRKVDARWKEYGFGK